ncbi:MAG: Nif3-like dinuclear metal center hexameric protein [Bacteroidota bacterium]
MKLKDLCSYLDSAVPLSFQEGYDNSGLQIGLPEKGICSAMITLDVTEEVIDEAVSEKCDIIISHHPLIFNGLKKITDKTYTERILYKAVKHDIAIYSSHTNLDIFSNSVSRKMAERLGLKNLRTLSPLKNRLLKLVTYIPESHLEKVRKAIFEAGAGAIGNYDQCGFTTSGTGSFRGNENARPFVGENGEIHFEKEIRFETVLFSHLKEKVIRALLEVHPYEEVAYDIYALENENIEVGTGCVGEFSNALSEDDFLNLVSLTFKAKGVRFSKPSGKQVKIVALCGGSGASLINKAITSGADAFVTADIKYHSFFDADNKILLIDTGHFESEKFSTEILYDLIIKKFPKFAVRFSETNTNPINYL